MKNISRILNDCGLNGYTVSPVMGGDINATFRVNNKEEKYFLKINDAENFPGMFVCESAGLEILSGCTDIKVPRVIKHGVIDNSQYLLLEWLEKGSITNRFWKDFGNSIAGLHKHPQAYFGFNQDNYIGSLQQANNVHQNWHDFYSTCRILPLVKQLREKGVFSRSDVVEAEGLAGKLKDIFPAEPPSLLHGDLWSGNFMVTTGGKASIYDPAVYFGHREIDIGMTLLFGGFDKEFYTAYNETYPLEKGWQQRVPLTQLYPLLVHAILFGGAYASSARAIIKKY